MLFRSAQVFPTKPVTLLVGFPAGGPSDVTARVLAERLARKWGQQVIVDNRPGANGNIGALEVVRAAPDGYTLLFATSSQLSINPALYSMPFDAQRDLAPIVEIAANPNAIVVHAGVPATSLKAFIELVRASPGKVSYASSGNGSINHLAAELLAMLTQIGRAHV